MGNACGPKKKSGVGKYDASSTAQPSKSQTPNATATPQRRQSMRRSTMKTSKGQFRKLRNFPRAEKIFDRIDLEFIKINEAKSNTTIRFNYPDEGYQQLSIETYNQDQSIRLSWGEFKELLSNPEPIDEISFPKDKIYKFFDNREGQPFAMKIYYFDDDDEFLSRYEAIINELHILQTLKKSGFQEHTEFFRVVLISDPERFASRSLLIFNELCICSMKDLIVFRKQKSLPWSEGELLHLFRSLLEIFDKLLNEFGIIHRDIKPQNILYSQADRSFKASDFSESYLMSKSGERAKPLIRGTPFYFSPELYSEFRSKSSSTSVDLMKSDIYSLGLTFLCMKLLKTQEDIESRARFETEKSCINDNSLSSNLILAMMDKDPNRRPTFQELLKRIASEDCAYVNENNNVEEILKIRLEDSKATEVKAEIAFEVGQGYERIYHWDTAIDSYTDAKNILQLWKNENKLARVCYSLSMIYFKIDLIEQGYKHAEPMFSKICSFYMETDSQFPLFLISYSKAMLARGDAVQAITTSEEALNFIESRYGKFNYRGAEVMELQGDCYERLKQEKESVNKWEEALSIMQKSYSKDKSKAKMIENLIEKIKKYNPDAAILSAHPPASLYKIEEEGTIQEMSFGLEEETRKKYASGDEVKKKYASGGSDKDMPAFLKQNQDAKAYEQGYLFYKATIIKDDLPQLKEVLDRALTNQEQVVKLKFEELRLNVGDFTIPEFPGARKSLRDYIQDDKMFKKSILDTAEKKLLFENDVLSVTFLFEIVAAKQGELRRQIKASATFYNKTAQRIADLEMSFDRMESVSVEWNNEPLEIDSLAEGTIDIIFDTSDLEFTVPICRVTGNIVGLPFSLSFRFPLTAMLFTKLNDEAQAGHFKRILGAVLKDRLLRIEINNIPLKKLRFLDEGSLREQVSFLRPGADGFSSEAVFLNNFNDNRFMLAVNIESFRGNASVVITSLNYDKTNKETIIEFYKRFAQILLYTFIK